MKISELTQLEILQVSFILTYVINTILIYLLNLIKNKTNGIYRLQ